MPQTEGQLATMQDAPKGSHVTLGIQWNVPLVALLFLAVVFMAKHWRQPSHQPRSILCDLASLFFRFFGIMRPANWRMLALFCATTSCAGLLLQFLGSWKLGNSMPPWFGIISFASALVLGLASVWLGYSGTGTDPSSSFGQEDRLHHD